MSRLPAVPRDFDPLRSPYWDDEILNPRTKLAAPLDEGVDVLDRGVDRAFENADDRIFKEQLLAEMRAAGYGDLDQRIVVRICAKEPGEEWEEVADDLGIALSTLKLHRAQLRNPDGPLFRFLGRVG